MRPRISHHSSSHSHRGQVVHVSGLPKHFTIPDLSHLFRGFPIDESTLKLQPDAVQCHGFVTFLPSAADSEIDSAIAKVRVYDGNILICKRYNPQPPPSSSSSSTNVVSNVIQIDYLTPDFSYFDVKTLIEQFGRIVEIRMTVAPGKDGITPYNTPQGRAYVEFEDPKSAQRVVIEAENNPPHPPQCPRPLLIRFATEDWKILAPIAPPGGRPNSSGATVPDPSAEQYYQQYAQNPKPNTANNSYNSNNNDMMQPGYYMYGAPGVVYPNGTNPNLAQPSVNASVVPNKVNGHPSSHVDSQLPHSHIQQVSQQQQQSQSSTPDVPANWKKIQEIMQEKIDCNLAKTLIGRTAVTERNDTVKKLSSQIQKTKRLEKRYVELREKFLKSQKKKQENDPIEMAELKHRNVKLTKELSELKQDYDWLQKHALELKESSEIQGKRFANLRALNDELCPYCSHMGNEADLGFTFLPKKRKQTVIVGGQRKKRKIEDDNPFADLENFDHILKERNSNTKEGDKEYLVMWADAKKSTWEEKSNICPVLVDIWNRDKNNSTQNF